MKNVLPAVLLISLMSSMAAAKSDPRKAPGHVADVQNFDGWVSDQKCKGKIDADCAKKCREEGVPIVFVNSDKTIIPVANQESLQQFVGQHVSIKGKLQNGTLTVNQVTSAGK